MNTFLSLAVERWALGVRRFLQMFLNVQRPMQKL